MVASPVRGSRCDSPCEFLEELWEVDVNNIDAELWMSPKEVENIQHNVCTSVAVRLGPQGLAGFGVRKEASNNPMFDNKVIVDKFNKSLDGSIYHAQAAGILQIGDQIQFVNNKLVTNIKVFVQLMRAEARVARTLPCGQHHVVVLGVAPKPTHVSPSRTAYLRIRQNEAEVKAARLRMQQKEQTHGYTTKLTQSCQGNPSPNSSPAKAATQFVVPSRINLVVETRRNVNTFTMTPTASPLRRCAHLNQARKNRAPFSPRN